MSEIFLLTVQTGISDLDLVLASHSFPLWMNEAALRYWNSIDSIPADKVLKRTHLVFFFLQKRFPIYHVSQMLGGPSLRLGIPIERLSIPPGIGWGGKDTDRLVTWEFPLRIDSASWKSFESFIQWISLCNSCILPVSSRIVSWSSTNLLLAIVSKVELWKFFNSSISLRLFWWASRNSEFCCNNRSWRSCWSRRWSSSAWAQWSSSCWDSIISHNFRTLLLSQSAWNSCFFISAWHSARICSFRLSNRVLICAFATFSSWPLGLTCRAVRSPTDRPVRSDTDDDDWPTDKPSRWEW